MTATMQKQSLLEALAAVPDPRARRGRRYQIASVLAIGVCAMACGARSLYAIAQWGKQPKRLVCAALEIKRRSTPSHPQLHRTFAALDREAFEAVLAGWLAERGLIAGEGIALDGKTLRGIHGEEVPGVHLDPLTKPSLKKAPTDERTADYKENIAHILASFPADAETAELMQPGERTLHHPPGLPQTTAMWGVALRQQGMDLSLAQPTAVRLGIIAPIPLPHVGPTPGSSWFPSYRWDRLDQRLQLGDIMGIGSRETYRQRNSVGVRNHVMFAARFGAIRGIRARLRPPQTARTEALSTTARDQSNWSAPRSRSKSNRCNCSQTPAACHSCSRRQQVIPEPQPISWGSISQGMPDRKTKRRPVSACRLGPGGRPPLGLGFSGGKRGAISSHNSSLTSAFALGIPSARECLRSAFHSNAFNGFVRGSKTWWQGCHAPPPRDVCVTSDRL